MKKLLLFLSLVLLVSCSSTRQSDNATYYKNYFSSVSLDNTSVVDQPVVPDTNYTDTNSTINVNLYTNSYWNWPYRNIYTNHWPYTNNIYSNDYYGYYTPLYYYNYYPYNGYNCWYGYQPHYYHLGNVYSYGWGRRINSPRYYTQNYSPRNIYNTPRTNYNPRVNTTPRTNYNTTPRVNTTRTNTTPRTNYNTTPRVNTTRTNTTPSYNNIPSNNSSGGRTSNGRR
jgi:hypothetical protein